MGTARPASRRSGWYYWWIPHLRIARVRLFRRRGTDVPARTRSQQRPAAQDVASVDHFPDGRLMIRRVPQDRRHRRPRRAGPPVPRHLLGPTQRCTPLERCPTAHHRPILRGRLRESLTGHREVRVEPTRSRTPSTGNVPGQDPGPRDTPTGGALAGVLVPTCDVHATVGVDDLVQVGAHVDRLLLGCRQVGDPALTV